MIRVELLRLEEADGRYPKSTANHSGHQGDARRKHGGRRRANLDRGETRPFRVKNKVRKITKNSNRLLVSIVWSDIMNCFQDTDT